MALEVYFEEGRKRCYSLRKDLEQFSAPAPSGEHHQEEDRSKLIDILNKRKAHFIKRSPGKKS